VRRQAVTALLALAALSAAGCGSSTQATKATPQTAPAPTTTSPTPRVTSASTVGEHAVCPSEQGAGIQASFGDRRTTSAAEALVAQAGKLGFRGLLVQQRGCNDYAVVLPGLKNLRQARDFRAEARSVGFHVVLECRSRPLEGGVAAVFGHRRTRRAALLLRRSAERFGFMKLQVQQDRCNDWEVALYGTTTAAQRRDLAKEAASVGFHLTFEPG